MGNGTALGAFLSGFGYPGGGRNRAESGRPPLATFYVRLPRDGQNQEPGKSRGLARKPWIFSITIVCKRAIWTSVSWKFVVFFSAAIGVWQRFATKWAIVFAIPSQCASVMSSAGEAAVSRHPRTDG